MKELPRLELSEDPNKKNDYIIFRHSIKSTKSKTNTKKRVTKKLITKNKKRGTKKRKHRKGKKGFLSIFT